MGDAEEVIVEVHNVINCLFIMDLREHGLFINCCQTNKHPKPKQSSAWDATTGNRIGNDDIDANLNTVRPEEAIEMIESQSLFVCGGGVEIITGITKDNGRGWLLLCCHRCCCQQERKRGCPSVVKSCKETEGLEVLDCFQAFVVAAASASFVIVIGRLLCRFVGVLCRFVVVGFDHECLIGWRFTRLVIS